MHPGRRYFYRRECGFTYVTMLFALAMFGIGLAALGESWSAASRRMKEAELIEIGSAYARAIGSYYQRSPGSQKMYPGQLDELVEDRRFVGVVRHLRQAYLDPVTGAEWTVIRDADGRIRGVYSASEKPVLRTRAIGLPTTTVTGMRYSDWKFIYDANNDKKT